MSDPAYFSIIIAANNERDYIAACLARLLAQDAAAGPLEIIVAANGCTDNTAQIVQDHTDAFAAGGHRLICLDLPEPGKLGALNAGDAVATGDLRAYLDADVLCDSDLFGHLRSALDRDTPLYGTGTLVVAPARSRITRHYARFWQRLPFVQGGGVGAGLFAVNAKGRARWGDFPDIISDDTFVRLSFAPQERIEVPARYHWPMIEGWAGLVRVRRRQDLGVAEIHRLYPALAANEGKAALGARGLLALAGRDPLGFAVYLSVHLAVRLGRGDGSWSRGR